MRNFKKQNLNLVRQSERFYQDSYSTDDESFNSLINYTNLHYPRMLIEDIHLSIMPYRIAKNNLSVSISPHNKDVENLIGNAVGKRDYGRNLYDSVAEFIRKCATEIMIHGKAVYEISYLYNSENKPEEFILFKVFPISIIEENGKLIQKLPAKVATEKDLNGNTIALSPENFVWFNLPDYMKESYLPMMDSLSRLSTETSMPDFAFGSITSKAPKVPFNVEKFTHNKTMAVVQACKKIGWRGRNILAPKFTTEYYDLHLFFLFEFFKAELRNSILVSLNEAIARAGSKLGFEAVITIKGIPTLSDIEDSNKMLAEGNCEFLELINPYL
ncbi:MAG: hypothetical protein JSS81_10260 [Acidobacteria bacterium]|nr:hypothetical protein [Acidobacteriota bacterium]